ncbi:MAG: hypothetical protein SFU57_07730 [Gemmatimonadales bacterium]|nr:hypothetical protein [Gemmatimonadales bacterium]
MSNDNAPHRSLSAVPAVLFIVSMMTFVQAFIVLKLCFLVAFLATASVDIARAHRLLVHVRLLTFYLIISFAGLVWSLIGLFNPGTYNQGVFDAARLYVVWSAAFVLLYSLLRTGQTLALMHRAFVLSGLLIPLLNFAGIADAYFGLNLIPFSLRTALELNVGIYDGYIQISSQNIGSMFLIAPYLVTSVLRTEPAAGLPRLTRLSLLLSVILVAASGRRALWLVFAITPVVIITLALVTRHFAHFSRRGRILLIAWTSTAVTAVGVVAVQPERSETSVVGRIQEAFSAQDERSLQKPYLIGGFKEAPFLGSGFGAYAGYSRSEQRPWTYELTYHKLLFNLGFIGTAILATLVFSYLCLVITTLREHQARSAIPFGLVVAFLSLLLGAYSNPYFGSFDFLFFVGLLPYLSTFQKGFGIPAAAIDAAAHQCVPQSKVECL